MYFASSKRIKSSVQKANQVAALIRGKRADRAILQLQFIKRSVAVSILKVLNSCIANSKNIKNIKNLYISEAKLNKHITLKRFMPRAKGRMERINRPFISIILILKKKSDGTKS